MFSGVRGGVQEGGWEEMAPTLSFSFSVTLALASASSLVPVFFLCFLFPFVSFSYPFLLSLSFFLCLLTPFSISLSLSPFFLIPGCIGQRGSKASCDIFDPWVHWQRGLSWDLSPSGVGVSSGGAGCGSVWNSGNLELWESEILEIWER